MTPRPPRVSSTRPTGMAIAALTSPAVVSAPVAVVVENGGDLGSEATGGKVAAPIAKEVIEAYLGARQ